MKEKRISKSRFYNFAPETIQMLGEIAVAKYRCSQTLAIEMIIAAEYERLGLNIKK